ncbi:site-specific DNA-methyltransferase [Pendulispora brunnea]|uniref:Methyltransferase n=1 Tax=Pendulispora brunnea TaxID=2905690 RepID=A0ABZ2K7D8_9BACT
MREAREVTLGWRGKERIFGAEKPGLSKAMPEPKVAYCTYDGSGELLYGDNLATLRALAAKYGESVTLAYLDPPFLTNRVHHAKKKGKTLDETTELPAFDDRWTDRAAYLEALGERLVAVRELLLPHGSVVIHVDPKTSHYVKVLCDEIFGDDCFASEIVWRYRRWPSKTPNFQRVHDVLLRYRKDARHAPRWNTLYEPLAASTLATWGVNKQRAVYAESGRRARSSTTREATAGVPMGDVWDIGVIAPVARERTGYPSQKPEALLERLLQSLSDPGDLVLDPYAGSGTTLSVAARLGRRFVGIDASEVAIATATRRLSALETPSVPAYGSAVPSPSR